MPALKAILFFVVPALTIGAAFVPEGNSPAAVAARVAAPILVALGLAPVGFSMSRSAGSALFLAAAGAACVGVSLAIRGAGPGADRAAACGWTVLTFAAYLGVVAPLLALDFRGAATALWLLLAALSCGSLAFVETQGGAIPSAFLEYNPLVRIFRHGLSFDWLHAANLYPRVGTSYYRYPERADGILPVCCVALVGVLSALCAMFLRRSRTAVP
jgi:hypothetical protein